MFFHKAQCGSTEVNHYHIFWNCPKLKNTWAEISKVLNDVFKTQITFSFQNLYLGQLKLSKSEDIKQLRALLAASKKAILRRWLSPTPPHIEEWLQIILDICKIEKLTYSLRIQKDKFNKIWNKWVRYISPDQTTFNYFSKLVFILF